MLPRNRWLNALIILLVFIAAIYLAEMLWSIFAEFSDIFLLFALAWLISFVLDPLITDVEGKPLPPPLTQGVKAVAGPRVALPLEHIRISRATAVQVIYLGLALFFVAIFALLLPAVVVQFSQLINLLPELAKHVPEWTEWAQTQIARMGLRFSIETAIQPALGALQSLSTTILQNMVVIFSSVVNVIANTMFVLILSFFFALDRPRLAAVLLNIVPPQYRVQMVTFSRTVDRTFGGFFRAQLIQALLMGAGTLVSMVVMGFDFSLVAGFFSGLFMAIPFIGTFLAFVPPILVALLTKPGSTLILFIALAVIQFIIVNVVAPRLVGNAVGLHPLVVFAALLVGVKVAGFWGALFGVPVAGVLVSTVIYFYRLWSERGTFAITPDEAEALTSPPPVPREPVAPVPAHPADPIQAPRD